jgi:hypothetical protein
MAVAGTKTPKERHTPVICSNGSHPNAGLARPWQKRRLANPKVRLPGFTGRQLFGRLAIADAWRGDLDQTHSFARHLALAQEVQDWCLTSALDKRVTIVAKIVPYARYATFQMAEPDGRSCRAPRPVPPHPYQHRGFAM